MIINYSLARMTVWLLFLISHLRKLGFYPLPIGEMYKQDMMMMMFLETNWKQN